MQGKSGVLIVLSLLAVPACSPTKATGDDATRVRLANNTGGPFARELAAQYSRTRSNLDVRLVEMGNIPNLESLARGDADITIGGADSVYLAYRNSVQVHSSAGGDIRALAALHVIPVHLLVRAPIDTAGRLRDAAVSAFGGTPIERLLFVTLGMDLTRVKAAHSPTDSARLVGEGLADVAFVGAYYPAESIQSAIQRGARLLSVEGPAIERLLRENRFVRQVTIPANTYVRHPLPIHTIGVDTIFVCRRDLDEAVAYELTKRLFEVIAALSRTFLGLRTLDVEQTPATPIPLHEGAARYYRELELLR